MKNNFTITALDFLLSIPEALVNGFVDRKEYYRLMGGYGGEQTLTCSNICNFLHSLKKRGYVEIVEKNGNESIIFTNKAKLAVVDKIAARASDDQTYTFVSFDIPESKKGSRDLFRRFIKRIGFRQVQQSLWVSKKHLGEMVEMAAEEYEVSEYVVYISANNTNINKFIEDKLKSEKNVSKK